MNSARQRLCVAAAISLISCTTATRAQQAATDSAKSGTAEADSSLLENVVVTAQRREERLQTVPVAVTAATAEDLQRAGLNKLVDLNQIAPGLNIQQRSSYTQPTIRGVGNAAQTLGNDPNIAFYVDGAYQPTGNGSQFRFPDVQRIEVLRGPQGTLFGRNATGGLLNVITFDPSADEIRAKGSISYGRFDTLDADAFVSGPLAENVAASLSSFFSRSDGYISNPNQPGEDVAEQRTWGVRGKVKIEGGDRFVATLSGQYSENDDPFPLLPTVLFDTSPFRTPGGPAPFITTTDSPYKVTANYAVSKFHEWSSTLNMTYAFDNFDLISTSSYRDGKYQALNDGDFTPYHLNRLSFDNEFDTLSEDVRLQSSGTGALKWLVGAFGISSKDTYLDWNNSSGVAPYRLPTYVSVLRFSEAYVETQAYAAYGQLSYDFTDQFTAIAGLRYSEEEKSVLADAVFQNVPRRQEGEETFSDTSPKVTLQYKFTPAAMAYVSYGEAFKSGTYNPLQITASAANQVVKPEEITAYEAGLKTDLSRNVRLNVAGFYYDYTNIQTTINNGLANLLLNAAAAEIKGGEVELLSNFPDLITSGDEVRLSANVAYLDARYTDFSNAAVTIYDPVTNDGQGCAPNVLVCNTIVDAGGNRVVRSPEWTGNISLGYSVERNWGTAGFDVAAFLSSSFFNNEANTAELAQESYEQVNASIFWRLPSERTTLSVWGKNLTDETLFITPYIFQGRGVGAPWYPPATYGVSARFEF